MDIRNFWLGLVERALTRRSVHRDRIRVIRGVLKELRVRERELLDRQRAVTDGEQRADLADKLSVLRMQREKGVRALREFRAERLAVSRRRVPDRRSASRTPPVQPSASPEHEVQG